MPKPSPIAPGHDEPLGAPGDTVYDAPTELTGSDLLRSDEAELSEAGAPREEPRPPPRPGALKLAVGIGVVLVVAASLLVYRTHHRRTVLRVGLEEAGRLIALDTADGYRQAASKLEPLAALDPLGAASVRAFALGMLFADYRDPAAEKEAEALLVAPFRAREVPPEASLAAAALALGRREAGNALTQALRAGDGPSALAMQARVALQAGNLEAAAEPSRTAAGAGLTAGLALHGDVLRRTRRDPAGARVAYEAALGASPSQPRAVFGLAKLGLAGAVPAAGAAAPLERLLADRERTPAAERGRAAVYLAALRLRADDAGGARLALDAAGLDPRGRSWAERASAVLAASRGPYRAVAGAPPSLQSASDDDPGVLAPIPPPPEPAKPVASAKPPPKPAPKKAAHHASSASKAKKPAAKKAPAKTTKSTKAPAKAPAKKPAAAPRSSTTATRR